jgi:hypothetical protein
MESTRQTWNDARMDEFAERTEENFREARRETHQIHADLHTEIQDVKTELKGDIQELRVEMNGRFAKLEGTFNRASTSCSERWRPASSAPSSATSSAEGRAKGNPRRGAPTRLTLADQPKGTEE